MLLIKTEVRASQIHGLGLFALEAIREHQPVWGMTLGMDVSLHEKKLEEMLEANVQFVQHFGFLSSKDNRWVIPLDNARYMNHDPKPNLRSDHGGRDVAARDIEIGEELTCDYRVFDADWERKLSARFKEEPGNIVED